LARSPWQVILEKIMPYSSLAARLAAAATFFVFALGPAGLPAQTVQSAPDAASEATVQSAHDYRIRQGDQVALTVFGEATLTPPSPLRVLQGGSIAVPLAGNVAVGGLTTSEASEAVARRLRKYLRDPKVTIAVVSVGPVEALVLGNVKVPGKYTLPPPARLTDVLAAAGGLGPTDGDFPDARLEYPDGTTGSASLQKLLHDGDTASNIAIASGETIYVPSPTLLTVEVVGAVDKPGDVAVREGDDVAMAIARAGTATQQQADLNHVTVTRNASSGGKTVLTVNLYDVLKKGDTSHDVVMQKGDVVYVPSSPKHSSPADLLFGISNLLPRL
jgi:polysaccharide export outer membrane protein